MSDEMMGVLAIVGFLVVCLGEAAATEARECLVSANDLLVKAEDGSAGFKVIVECIGSDPAIDRLKRPIEIEALPVPSNGDKAAAPVVPAPSDEAERGPAESSPQPSSSIVPPPPVSQSKGFAIMPPEPPRRGIPLTRTGAAMAFLRGRGTL